LYRRGRAVFFAFDLLWLNNTDLRQTPLIERKKKLRRLIEGSECSEIIYAQHVERDGKLLFQEVCERNLEGIVAKRKTGVYPEHGWLKIKNPNYSQSERRHEMFEAFHERRKSG
jgi:bifunctional non-homologous end joining protein LigD